MFGRAPTLATGLRQFSAAGSRFGVPEAIGGAVDWLAASRCLRELQFFDLESLELHPVDGCLVELWEADRGFVHRCFADQGFGGFAVAGLRRERHRDVDGLEDAARSDAEHTVRRFDEVVPFAAEVLTAEVVDKTKTGIELLGVD